MDANVSRSVDWRGAMTQAANIPTPSGATQEDPYAWHDLELAEGWESPDNADRAQYRIYDWNDTKYLETRGQVTATQEFPYWFTISTLPVEWGASRRKPAVYTNQVQTNTWLTDTWCLFLRGGHSEIHGQYNMGIRVGGMLNLDGVLLVVSGAR
ncbi:hypothetical protein G5C51_12870 [Streptomyces sp. A7024]|uniref:Uncharacterized protein n=1 Tax=Streptomyces coryli TaxID=1128680 RepID=A0A6G4U084_9ACTN|nr:hypothetical protein [Streptomyces coryli]NGN64788.1 hypothetical protein [Streptomyces coryli]